MSFKNLLGSLFTGFTKGFVGTVAGAVRIETASLSGSPHAKSIGQLVAECCLAKIANPHGDTFAKDVRSTVPHTKASDFENAPREKTDSGNLQKWIFPFEITPSIANAIWQYEKKVQKGREQS